MLESCIADDVEYLMVRETQSVVRESASATSPSTSRRRASLELRVKRLETEYAWAEDPHRAPATS